MPLKGAIDTERAKSILRESFGGLRLPGNQFTCLTGTEVQILTPTCLPGTSCRETAGGAAVLEYLTAGGTNSKVLSLLALLVQKYKY